MWFVSFSSMVTSDFTFLQAERNDWKGSKMSSAWSFRCVLKIFLKYEIIIFLIIFNSI